MNDLVITISWEVFLGIMGSIIAVAYYAIRECLNRGVLLGAVAATALIFDRYVD